MSYTYKVTAFDNTATGAMLGESQAGTDAGQRTLNAPTNVQATDGTFEDKIEVTWEDNSGVEVGYHVYRKLGEAASVRVDGDMLLADATAFTDNSVVVGATYTYSVEAFDNEGASVKVEDDGSTAILPAASFNASDNYGDRVVLAWVDASSQETSYEITRNGTKFTPNAPANAIMFTDTMSPVAGTEYEYCIVAINGTYRSIQVCDLGGIPGSPSVPQPPGNAANLTLKLLDSDGVDRDQFGTSVSISGDYAIVGSKGDDSNKGSALIFKRSGTTWTEQTKLTASDGATSDQFGTSVSISGDYAIVGADGDDSNKGAAYVFLRSGSTWTQQMKLTDSDGAAIDDRFGTSVSISGDYAIIGAIGDDGGVIGIGSAFIFQRSGTTWTEQTKLIASDGVVGDRFGTSVSISGDYAIVGAVNDGNEFRGSAYLLDLAAPINVAASDGAFDDRVQITWEDRSEVETGYRVFRDGHLITQTEPGAIHYNDFDAVPGGLVEYCVAGIHPDLGETARVCNIGRIPPDGNITGRIATAAGTGVDGVTVCLDPTPTKALVFDGDGGRVEMDDVQFPGGSGLSSFTVEFWMKSNAQNKGTPFSYGLDNQIALFDYENFRLFVNGQSETSNVSASDGQWHHIAMTWRTTDNRVQLFKDGMLEFTGTIAAVSIPAGSVFVLGQKQDAFNPAEAFKGQMDEVRLWNIVRTEQQIADNKDRTLTGAEDGLIGYWPLDQGNGLVATDLTENDNYGRLEGGVYWSDFAPESINTCALTDNEGNYVLADIRYGAETTFAVTPAQTGHAYSPAFKTITLSTGNPVQNEVGFIDITTFSVSGQVKFENTDCPVENAQLFVDGLFSRATDVQGKFALPVAPGEHVIAPELGGHGFIPAFFQATVTAEVGNVLFADTTKNRLTGRIGAGGPGCAATVGELTLVFVAENACFPFGPNNFKKTFSDGNYVVDLPLQKYFVSVESTNPLVQDFFDNIGPQEVDLTGGNVQKDFVYRAPIAVALSGLPETNLCTITGAPQVPILMQGQFHTLTITVDEDYGSGNLCPADTGSVTLFDEIIDQADAPVTLEIHGGVAQLRTPNNQLVPYATAGNTPNIFEGRIVNSVDRSYQKFITAVAEVAGQAPVQDTKWAYVDGHRPRPGAAFFSATSQRWPTLILRDPPGDASFSYLEKDSTYCHTIRNIESAMLAAGINTTIKVGLEFRKGVGFATKTEFSATAETGLKLGFEATQTNELQTCVTTTQQYATSDTETFVGDDADIFIGGAMNFGFTRTDVIGITNVDGTCTVDKSLAVTIDNQGFETTYAYTVGFIRDILIPTLEQNAQSNPDLAVELLDEAANWQQHLDLNNSLKVAAALSQNRSFSAGANFEFSNSIETATAFEWTYKVFTESEASLELGFEESGSGISGKLFLELSASNTREETTGTTKTRTIGYRLADNDIGDNFSVDVKNDQAYATPVFELRAGTSSCPWEFSPTVMSVPRDGPTLSLNPVQLDGVPQNQPAVFSLFLGNESLEAREYELRVIGTSNPYGARVKVNGGLINGPQSFFIAAGQLPGSQPRALPVSLRQPPGDALFPL